jgi:hypothetical protein
LVFFFHGIKKRQIPHIRNLTLFSVIYKLET